MQALKVVRRGFGQKNMRIMIWDQWLKAWEVQQVELNAILKKKEKKKTILDESQETMRDRDAILTYIQNTVSGKVEIPSRHTWNQDDDHPS